MGSYVLIDVLGEGGMAVVHRARHRDTGALVALKLARSADRHRTESIRREARILGHLRHPGVAALVDSNATAEPPWLATELVPGVTLRGWLGTSEASTSASVATAHFASDTDLDTPLHGPSSERASVPPQVWTVLHRLARTLAWIHGEQAVHGDLKPENVIVDGDAFPVLVDFGVARQLDPREFLDTPHGMGTALYLSPEGARRAPTDARSDLYSLGCMLYEVLTGRPPFVGDTVRAVIDQHRLRTPAPPSELGSVRPELDALVLGLLEKAPADRVGHAQVVAAALAPLDPAPLPPLPEPRPYLYRPPVLGRDGVLDALRTSNAPLTLITGEPGIGATRVLSELARDDAVAVRVGRGRRGLRDALGALPARVGPPMAGDSAAREQYIDALVQGLRTLGAAPTRLLLDRVHRAPPTHLEALQRWAGGPTGHLKVVATVPREHADVLDAPTLALSRLAEAQTAALIAGMLGRSEAPSGLSQRLHEVSRGNPRLAVEYLHAAVRSGQLERDDEGRWYSASEARWAELPAPNDLDAAAEARLAALGPTRIRHAAVAALFDMPLDESVAAALGLPIHDLIAEHVLGEDLRFTFEPVRDAARRTLDADEAAATHRRIAEAFAAEGKTEAAIRHRGRAGDPAVVDALAELGASHRRHGALEAAAEAWTLVLDIDDRPSLRADLVEVLFEMGDIDRAATHARQLTDHADAAAQITGWIHLGRCVQQTDLREAIPMYERAERLARATAAPQHSTALRHLASCHRMLGEPELAAPVIEQAIAAATTPRDLADAQSALASLLYRRGDVDRAEALMREVLAGLDADQLARVATWTNLGSLLRTRGRFDEATAVLEGAIDLGRRLGRRRDTQVAQLNLALVYLDHGRIEQARAALEDCQALARDRGDLRSLAVVLGNLGVVEHELGRFRTALRHLDEAARLHEERGRASWLGWTRCQLGRNHLALGDVDQARTDIEAGLAVSVRAQDPAETANASYELARVERFAGHHDRALTCIDQALAGAAALDNALMRPMMLAERGHLALARGEDPTPWLTEARAVAIERGPQSEAGRAVARLERAVESEDTVCGEDRGDIPQALLTALSRP